MNIWLRILKKSRDVKNQSLLLYTLILIALLYVSPTPSAEFPNSFNLLIILYWLMNFFLIWATWFQESLRGIFYFLSLLLSFIISIMTFQWFLFVTLAVLGFWLKKRLQRTGQLTLWFLFVFNLSPAWSQTELTDPLLDSPTAPGPTQFMNGLMLKNIVSCSTIDKIPWQLREDGRKIRLIVKDLLTFSNDREAFDWELYQIINPKALITYVFKRVTISKNGDIGHEYVAVRGDKMERIVQTNKKLKSSIVPVKSLNLKELINRTAFTFYHKDGSTLEYVPGPTERSTVIIKPMHQGGYTLSPVYLNGIGCDRPESLKEDDLGGDALGTKRSKENANPQVK